MGNFKRWGKTWFITLMKLLKHEEWSQIQKKKNIGRWKALWINCGTRRRKGSHPVLPFAWRPVGYVGTHGHPVVQNPNTGHIFGRERQGGPYERRRKANNKRGSWKGTHLGLRISLLRFACMSHDLYMTLRNISPIGMVLTQGCSYIPARLWPLVSCGDRLETMCVEETPCISGGIESKCTRSERRWVAISYRLFVRILSEEWDKKHTPCNTEFMKHVLPWFMRPGGR